MVTLRDSLRLRRVIIARQAAKVAETAAVLSGKSTMLWARMTAVAIVAARANGVEFLDVQVRTATIPHQVRKARISAIRFINFPFPS